MPDSNRPLKVFLCHASADKPSVRDLYGHLENDGVNAWLDSEDLIPGQNWRVEIPKAVENSDIVLVCLSENSVNKEGYVQKEISFALDKALEMPEGRIFLIPVRLEACNVPRRLSDYQWVDLFSENGYERLMLALKLRAEQIGAQPPGRKGWLPKKVPKPVVPIPKTDTPPSVEDQEPSEKIAAVSTSETEIFKRHKGNARYVIAIIGVAGAIIAMIVGSPYIARWFSPSPESTLTETAQALPLFTEALAVVTTTDVVSLTITATSTVHPTISPTRTIPSTALPSEITDQKGVGMALVPEGKFTMGNIYQQEQQVLYLDSFYIDKYEVTNGLYRVCVDNGDCQPPQNLGSKTHSFYYGYSSFDTYPVIFVDWYQAKGYCEWRGARLPTEAEWEKAARGTDAREYAWGSGYTNSGDMCTKTNYKPCKGDVRSVGGYESGKSVYGAYDMTGNVLEWTSSLFMDYPYDSSDGRENVLASGDRVARGGFFEDQYFELMVYDRWDLNPNDSLNYLGFRCARGTSP